MPGAIGVRSPLGDLRRVGDNLAHLADHGVEELDSRGQGSRQPFAHGLFQELRRVVVVLGGVDDRRVGFAGPQTLGNQGRHGAGFVRVIETHRRQAGRDLRGLGQGLANLVVACGVEQLDVVDLDRFDAILAGDVDVVRPVIGPDGVHQSLIDLGDDDPPEIAALECLFCEKTRLNRPEPKTRRKRDRSCYRPAAFKKRRMSCSSVRTLISRSYVRLLPGSR